MSARIQARVTHRFDASPERVFDAWVRPESVRRWLKAALTDMGLEGDTREVRVDARPGGSYCFSDMRSGREARHWGTYLEFDRPRRLVFTWITDESEEADPSVVTLTIEPEGAGCIAALVHDMGAAWSAYLARTQDGWEKMLRAIDSEIDPPGR